MRVLIATGGTGGHIYPALALADAMKEKDPANGNPVCRHGGTDGVDRDSQGRLCV